MQHIQRGRGFTLIEMLISLFILSIATAFVAVIINTVGLTRDAAYESVALHIAQNELDTLRAAGYDQLPSSGAFSNPQLASLPQGSASTTVADWNDKTKEVTTSVSWQGVNGTPRIASLTTLITQVGGL